MSSIDRVNAPIPRPGEDAETAYYEQVVFAKINIRAPEGNTQGEFSKLVNTLDASFSGKGLLFTKLGLEGTGLGLEGTGHRWEVSRFYLQNLHSAEDASFNVEELVNFESRVLLFTFRNSHEQERQIVAIDRKERWVATTMPATTSPEWAAIRSSRHSMADELQRLIQRIAASQLDQSTVMYDVDLICSTATIRAWLESHQFITYMILSTLPTNPGIDLEPIRRQLLSIKARISVQNFEAYPKQRLEITPDFATDLGKETENGNARVAFTAQSRENYESYRTFNSDQSSDTEDIETELSPLQAMVRVVRALIHRRVQPAK